MYTNVSMVTLNLYHPVSYDACIYVYKIHTVLLKFYLIHSFIYIHKNNLQLLLKKEVNSSVIYLSSTEKEKLVNK